MKIKGLIAIALALALVLTGCSSQVPFTVVARGAPSEAPEFAQARFLALRSGDSYQTLVADLPADAAVALAAALAEGEQGLYILVYSGQQPTAGISVHIDRIEQSGTGGIGQLTVRWALERPAEMAAEVITHPWILVFIAGSYETVPQVEFVQIER